jgi:hypothetical protein
LKGKVTVGLLHPEGGAIPTTVSQQGSGLLNVSLPVVRSKGMYYLQLPIRRKAGLKKLLFNREIFWIKLKGHGHYNALLVWM